MEGVLIDSLEYNWKARNQYFNKKFGFQVTKEEIDSMIGMSLKDQLEIIGKVHDVNLNWNECSKEFTKRQFEIMGNNVKPNDECIKFIKRLLTDNKKIAVCSHNIRSNVLRGLELVGLQNLFEVIVAIEDFNIHKPNEESLILTSQKLEVDPSECAVIEDSPKGIIAAKKAKMFAIGYKTKFNSEEALMDAGADLVIDKFLDLNKKL